MPWSDGANPTPERSEAELLALVQARAGRIRRRRRVLSASAGLAVVVALVAGVVALAQPGSGRPSSLHVTGPAPSSPPPVAVTEASTSTTEAPTSTSTTPATTVTTVRVTTPPPPSTTPVTAAPATVATTTSTTTTTVPAPVPCQPSEVLVTATPSKATYAPGETITVTAAAENRSGHPCYPADPRLEFSDATGKGLGGVAVADMFTMGGPGEPPPTWAPGRILSAPFNWQCPGSPGGCPAGAYTVVASFGSFRSAPASFTVGG